MPRFVRTSDVGDIQKEVLERQSELFEQNAQCVFGSLSDRLDGVAREFLDALIKPEKGDSLDCAVEKNRLVHEYCLANTWMCKPTSVCICSVHDCHCPVFPLQAILHPDSFAIELSPKEGCNAWWRQYVLATPPLYPAAKRVKSCSAAFEDADDSNPQPRPLSLTFGGITCVDYCSVGKQKRLGGPHEKDHAIYMQSLKVGHQNDLIDVSITEHSSRYPGSERQGEALDGCCRVISIKGSAVRIGFPNIRTRSFGAIFNLSTMVWLGPDSDESIENEFYELFGRPCDLDGSVYMQASDIEVQGYCQELASTRKNILPDDWRTNSLLSILPKLGPVGYVHRYAEHEQIYKKQASDNYFADLEHHPGKGVTHGRLMPTMLTHGFDWWFQPDTAKQRPVTPRELYAASGFDVYNELCADRPQSEAFDLMRDLKSDSLKLLVGNGLHLPTAALWIMYVLANVLPRSDFFSINEVVVVIEDSDEDEGLEVINF
jgi:hypothetical protein